MTHVISHHFPIFQCCGDVSSLLRNYANLSHIPKDLFLTIFLAFPWGWSQSGADASADVVPGLVGLMKCSIQSWGV